MTVVPLRAAQAARLTPRLTIGGYWGVPSKDAISANYTARELFQAAQLATGGVRGVSLGAALSGGSLDLSQEGPREAVLPRYTLPIDEARNTKAAWPALSIPNQSFYIEAFNPFGNGKKGLYYTNGAANGAARWAGPNIPYMRAHWLRLNLAPTHEDQKRQVVGYTWRDGTGRGWRFEIVGSEAFFYRLATTYTEANQTALNNLLNTDVALTDTQQQQENDLRAGLYTAQVSLGSLLMGAEGGLRVGLYTFIPESIGRVVIMANGVRYVLELPEIINSGSFGTLWDESTAQLSTSGGVQEWQCGLVNWFTKASIAAPSGLTADAAMSGKFDTSLPGTGIAFALDNYDSYPDPANPGETITRFAPKITFTSTGAHPARLYFVQGFIEGGERVADNTTVFDSGASPTITDGVTKILDYDFSCNGENEPLHISVTLKDVEENINIPGYYRSFGHDRLTNLYINGTLLLGTGLITESILNDAAKSNTNQPKIYSPASQIVLEVADMWTIADEYLIWNDLIFDGEYVNDMMRRVLKMMGCKPAQIAGIPAGEGPRFDKSAIGEPPLYRTPLDTSAGDLLRQWMAEYYPNHTLSPRTGIWTLAPKDLGIKAKFLDTPNPLATNPPEFHILEPLDLLRDFSDIPNQFQRVGARDAYGQSITARYTRQEAIVGQNNPRYVGRIKRARTVVDESYSSTTAVQRGVRGDAAKQAKPGRWYSFTSIFIRNLYPGHRVILGDNTTQYLCEIESMNGTQINEPAGRVSWVVRELGILD